MILCFSLTDEIYAVAITKPDSVGPAYLYGILTAPYIGWTAGTLLGALVGSVLPARLEAALGITIYAMFLAIIVPPMRREPAQPSAPVPVRRPRTKFDGVVPSCKNCFLQERRGPAILPPRYVSF